MLLHVSVPSWTRDLTFIFLVFRPLNRGDDGTLTIFQNRLINMLKATIQNVHSTVIDDTSTQVYDRLKEREEIKDLMKKDIEDAWQRVIEPGQRSDKVIND